MNNITLSIEDDNEKAKAYLYVNDDKELTIQVVAGEGLQYDFVLSEDDLKLIDFLRKKK